MDGFTPTRRMMTTDGALYSAVNELCSAMCAHAAYYQDPVELILMADELRAQLAGGAADKARVLSLLDQIAGGLRRGTADKRQLIRLERCASDVRAVLADM